MEDGHIVEQGSHAELLSRAGAYFELYNSQFVGAITDVDPEDPAVEARLSFASE
jgi:ATP-binding cassette subfamily B protein